MIEARDWDSEVLGRRCGTLIGMPEHGEAATWDHVIAISDPDDWPRVRQLEDAGFRLVAQRIQYRGTVYQAGSDEKVLLHRPVRSTWVALAATTAPLFARSRFYADPSVTTAQTSELHHRWVWDALRDSRVFVALDAVGHETGIVIWKPETDGLRIELIATLNGVRKQGRALLYGLGNMLGEHRLIARTQMSNLAAARMYLAVGMKPIGADVVHAWSRS